jgi:hypothetical protein
MYLLTNTTDYTETINMANNLKGQYNKSVIFHCYWYGELNEKHFYSILSCYYFNVYKNKHKIIVWLENNKPNIYNTEIEKYAEIKYFFLNDEIFNTNYFTTIGYYNRVLSFYSDVVRYLLLYNYGGIWFDLDCFILRSFDPIFYNYENKICVYQWENQNYPNGAIYISLIPKSETMKNNIQYIINKNCGWGFQEASLTYDLSLDMFVLPCSWFDPSWITNTYNINFDDFFINKNKEYNFDNFFKGSFCYHWHNQWNKQIEDNSILFQLVKIIKENI